MNTSKGIVARIEDQGDRILLYIEDRGDYHVIASPAKAASVRVGDSIDYEPYGYNFGWLTNES